MGTCTVENTRAFEARGGPTLVGAEQAGLSVSTVQCQDIDKHCGLQVQASLQSTSSAAPQLAVLNCGSVSGESTARWALTEVSPPPATRHSDIFANQKNWKCREESALR